MRYFIGLIFLALHVQSRIETERIAREHVCDLWHQITGKLYPGIERAAAA